MYMHISSKYISYKLPFMFSNKVELFKCVRSLGLRNAISTYGYSLTIILPGYIYLWLCIDDLRTFILLKAQLECELQVCARPLVVKNTLRVYVKMC